MPPETYVAPNSMFVPELDAKPKLDIMLFLQNLLILTAIIFLYWLISREADVWNANPIAIFRPGGILLTLFFFAALWMISRILSQLVENHPKIRNALKYGSVIFALLFMVILYVNPVPFNQLFYSTGVQQIIQRMEPVRIFYGQEAIIASDSLNGVGENQYYERYSAQQIAQKMHEAINSERTRIGLPALQFDSALASIAEKHSRDMLQRNYFDHVSPEGRTFIYRYAQANYPCEITYQNQLFSGGENLGQSYVYNSKYENGLISDYKSAEEMATQLIGEWMNSSSHRANILHPYWINHGIGVVIEPEGKVLITENFC